MHLRFVYFVCTHAKSSPCNHLPACGPEVCKPTIQFSAIRAKPLIIEIEGLRVAFRCGTAIVITSAKHKRINKNFLEKKKMKKAITTIMLATTLMVTNSFAGIIIANRSTGETRSETKNTTCTQTSKMGDIMAAIAGIIIANKTGIIIANRLALGSEDTKCTQETNAERDGIIIAN